jgi:PTS system nitrogen regulatory IIA component
MKLSELISDDLILLSLQGTDPSSVLREFAEAVTAAGKYTDAQSLFEHLYDREKQESTGIGNGVSIPHCKLDNLQEVVIAVGYSRQGVPFHAVDGKPTHFFFMVISPASSSVLHLRALAALSRLLRSATFLSQLRQWPGKQELLALIKQEEERIAVAS